MANMAKISFITDSLNIPDDIKKEVLLNVDKIEVIDFLEIVEKYLNSVKKIKQKNKHVSIEYVTNTNNFKETLDKQEEKLPEIDF